MRAGCGGRTLDFVVVGFGLGACAMLLGVLLLGWMAGRAEGAAANAPSPAAATYGRAMAAEHRAAGQALLYAGGAVILAAIGGLLGGLDDRTGAFLVATVATVGALGLLFRGYLHRSRHPRPPRPRARRQSLPGSDSAQGSAPALEESWVDPSLPASTGAADAIAFASEPLPAFVFAEAAVNDEHDAFALDPETAKREVPSAPLAESAAQPDPVESELLAPAEEDRGTPGSLSATHEDEVHQPDSGPDPPVIAVVAPGVAGSAPWAAPSDDDDGSEHQ